MRLLLSVLLLMGMADALVIWACLRVAAEADRQMEEYQKELR